jgi:hypothetical protein
MTNTLVQNLPDIDMASATSDDDDEEVLPLDFRTNLIKSENKVVI